MKYRISRIFIFVILAAITSSCNKEDDCVSDTSRLLEIMVMQNGQNITPIYSLGSLSTTLECSTPGLSSAFAYRLEHLGTKMQYNLNFGQCCSMDSVLGIISQDPTIMIDSFYIYIDNKISECGGCTLAGAKSTNSNNSILEYSEYKISIQLNL